MPSEVPEEVMKLAREIAAKGGYETDDGVVSIILAAILRTTELAADMAETMETGPYELESVQIADALYSFDHLKGSSNAE